MTVQCHRGLTEQAANAAIDTACRMQRLPTIRAPFPDLATTAARERMTYRGFLAELLTFGVNIIETGSDSYRLAHTKNQQGSG